jgi:hypothetical protein
MYAKYAKYWVLEELARLLALFAAAAEGG